MSDSGSCINVSFRGSMDGAAQACERLMEFIGDSPAAVNWFEVSLILQEAVNNAVLHGCKDSSEHEVRVTVCYDQEKVKLVVRHNGDSWDWRAADWSLPEPDSLCGRGLFIIRHYADHILFSDDGKSLTLIRRLDSFHDEPV